MFNIIANKNIISVELWHNRYGGILCHLYIIIVTVMYGYFYRSNLRKYVYE
jgi:hypothetical protein